MFKIQAALIQRGWDRSERVLQARHVRCHPGAWPWSPGMGPGWADDIQCWCSNSSLGKQGITLHPDPTAAPVPLQQMPWEKLASHTNSQHHRSPWPAQTAYILYIGVCIDTTATMCYTERNNPNKDFEPSSVIFDLMRERGISRHNEPTNQFKSLWRGTVEWRCL